jgi:hypothetical protein
MPGSHVPRGIRRTKAEMQKLDVLIREVHEQTGHGARRIAHTLAERLGQPVDESLVVRRLKRCGLGRTVDEAIQATRAVPVIPVPFTKKKGVMSDVAHAKAISWFAQRGYTVSLPIQATSYDFVVESDEGLKRIQFKSAESKNDKSASWRVNVCRGQGWSRKRRTYTKDEVDLFFILTGDNDVYLIPIDAIEGKERICLDVLYRQYRQEA